MESGASLGARAEEFACNAGDAGWIPGLGRSTGRGHSNPRQYSCLQKSHGQRSLVGFSPWGHAHTCLQGNGRVVPNPTVHHWCPIPPLLPLCERVSNIHCRLDRVPQSSPGKTLYYLIISSHFILNISFFHLGQQIKSRLKGQRVKKGGSLSSHTLCMGLQLVDSCW